MNKQLEHLVNYVDKDLILILTDEQRDNIISFATAALVADERVQTRKEQGEAMVDAAHRITPIRVPLTEVKKDWKHAVKVYIAAIGVILMAAITAFFYLSTP